MLSKEWAAAAGIRAVKTFAQTILGMIAVGAAFDDVVWVRVLSVAAVAAVLSLLTSIVGLPELGSDGTMIVNTSDPNKDVYILEMTTPLEMLPDKKTVTFKVQK